MVQAKRSFGHARDSSCRFKMSNRGLNGSHDTWILPVSACPERLTENRNLGRISQSRSCAMSFDISHLVKRHLRLRVNLTNKFFLSVGVWRSDAVRSTVMIDRSPANNRINLILIPDRRYKRFKQNKPGTFTAGITVSSFVKCFAEAISG